jgi:riboflavin kinase/FMN adenylyltransferase
LGINISKENASVAALGIFDGVHLGHRAVIDTAVKKAREIGAQPSVFTFDTSSVTSKGRFEPLITNGDKISRLSALGIKKVYCSDFSRLRDMSAERFVKEILVGNLNAVCAVCGEDFRFGKGGEGSADDLKKICAELGIEVCTVSQLKKGGEAVSSTRIRELIKSGEIAKANELLGWHYGYCAQVVHGFARGRTINFPTINQLIPLGLILPKFGVYCSKVCLDGMEYAAVTNIGVKPTVENASPPLAETYIIGYSGDLYGRTLETSLYEFIRPEKKFESFEELKSEIERNTEYAKKYFERNV